MIRTAELAERLDVRLHTHFAENAEDDEFSLATFGCRPMEYLERTGWASDRTWVAHCVMPNAHEIARLGAAGVGVAHCPSSNLILSSGIAPVVDLRAGGVPVGLGVDGSSSAGTARMALEMATLGGAACLGRTDEIGVLARGPSPTWRSGRCRVRSSPEPLPTRSRPGCDVDRSAPATRSCRADSSCATAGWCRIGSTTCWSSTIGCCDASSGSAAGPQPDTG